MNKLVAAFLAVALLLLAAAPSAAWTRHPSGHHGHYGHGGAHTRIMIGVAPLWWGPHWPHRYPYYPRPYYVYPPPPVIVQEPPVYVQQAPPPPPPPPPAYWYYCASAKAYYPNVQTCPEEWIKVPPRVP